MHRNLRQRVCSQSQGLILPIYLALSRRNQKGKCESFKKKKLIRRYLGLTEPRGFGQPVPVVCNAK